MWSASDCSEINKGLQLSYRMCSGRELAPDMQAAYVAALSEYSPEDVIAALRRCYTEHRGHLSTKDIIDRLPAKDESGDWPGANAAWAACPSSEAETVIWTTEASEAHHEATVNTDDPTAQRLAFRELYENKVKRARDAGRRPRWHQTLGTDKAGREQPLRDAERRGLISAETVRGLLPDGHSGDTELKQLMGGIEERMGEDWIAEIIRPLTSRPDWGCDKTCGTSGDHAALARELQAKQKELSDKHGYEKKRLAMEAEINRRQRWRDDA